MGHYGYRNAGRRIMVTIEVDKFAKEQLTKELA
jgi:hypothetical protein